MKMLCIDGGGIRGVFPITILSAIEKDLGKPIGTFFDVVAGTSTGSIIASSIAMKKNMEELLEQYERNGEKIFRRQAKIGLFKSVYSDKYLRHYLQDLFGNVVLKDITYPLIIPAVDVTFGKPYAYRSNYGNPESEDLKIKLWDAVLSSCSAPLYFPPNNIKNHYLSVDGGLWANNPSLVCITEGLQFFKESLEEIEILSIGTGQQVIDFSIDKNRSWGVKKWLPLRLTTMKVTPKLLDLALHLSSESVTYQCQTLLGDNYLRINKNLGEEMPFDDLEYMDELLLLADEVYKEKREKILAFIKTRYV